MDDLVAPPFQFAQKSWQHLGCLRLCVVKKHDTAPDLFDTGKDET
jgi:hypothetical protein